MASVKIEGLADFEAALNELSKATARTTLYRVLDRAAKPIDTAWRAKAPVLKGGLKRSGGIQKATTDVGNKAYSAALRGGSDQAGAVSAKRDALRNRDGAFAEVVVGPGSHPKALISEIGSYKQAPRPYLTPAFDENVDEAEASIQRDIGAEIMKSASRARIRAARKAGG